MNPLLSQFLTALLRDALKGAGAFLVARGVLTSGQADEMIGGLIVFLISTLWTLYVKWKGSREHNTGMAMAQGSTHAEVKDAIKSGVSASAFTPADVSPTLERHP